MAWREPDKSADCQIFTNKQSSSKLFLFGCTRSIQYLYGVFPFPDSAGTKARQFKLKSLSVLYFAVKRFDVDCFKLGFSFQVVRKISKRAQWFFCCIAIVRRNSGVDHNHPRQRRLLFPPRFQLDAVFQTWNPAAWARRIVEPHHDGAPFRAIAFHKLNRDRC